MSATKLHILSKCGALVISLPQKYISLLQNQDRHVIVFKSKVLKHKAQVPSLLRSLREPFPTETVAVPWQQ